MGTFKVVSHAMCANHPAHLDEGLPFNNTFLTHDVSVVFLQLDVLEVFPNLRFWPAENCTL